jgi:O-antigen/teichoic acid export membrane protein
VGLVGANGVQAILSALYLVVVSRALGPADFGLTSAALSFAVLFGILQGPFEMKISKDAAILHGSGQEARLGSLVLRSLGRLTWPLLACLTIAYLLAAPVSAWFNLGSSAHLILMASYVAIAFVLCLTRGALRGGHRFAALASNQITESGARLLVGFALISLGGGAVGAIAGYVSGTAVAAAVALFQLLGTPRTGDRDGPIADTATTVGPLFILYLYWTLAANLDVVIARRFLDPENSGYYAAAANLARMIWLVGTPICHLILVRSASLEAGGQNGGRLAKKAVTALAAALLLSCVIPFVAGPLLIRMVFGKAFLAAASPLGILWIATILSVLQAAVAFSQIGADRIRRPGLFLVPCALLPGLLSIFHDSAAQIAYCALASSLCALAISAVTVAEGRTSQLANDARQP